MLNAQLAELEQEYRKNWHGYQPHAYQHYLQQVTEEERVALLARLLSVELEYAYQPPKVLHSTADIDADDDDRAEPRVMLFLHRFPQLRQHREVVIQLVMLEFALRLRFDPQAPNYDSYLDLCPEEKERVGGMMQVMEEKLHRAGSTGPGGAESDKDDTTVAEGVAEKTISFAQLPCSLGYFLLTNVIGHGGMGTVYSAVDLRSAAHVAVKIINRSDSWSVYRFIEEFTWLSTLNHPNVVKLYDTFSEGELRYFSMEVVEGQPISKWFQNHDPNDRWGSLRRVLSQAALAVAFLHDHDVIHRDIKGSNLMISGRGRAVLLDLGLASRIGDQQTNVQKLDGEPLVGTLHYLPPEMLHGSGPTFASDWYSFGVMMYETITGGFPPVKVDMLAAVGTPERYCLNSSQAEKMLADCPGELANLCLEMLCSDAARRPVAADIIRRLGSDVGQPIPLAVSDADFVGRERGLEFLSAGLHLARQGQPVVRLIRGESGMGKTALLNRWTKKYLDQASTLRLSIRCHSQDHTPLRALNLLVQELVTCLSQRPTEFWSDLSRGGGEEIVYAFPQMERLGGSAWPTLSRTADSMEGVARRSSGLHALLGWLRGLSQRVNLVISIDDAHWADAESGRILSRLFPVSEGFRGLVILVDQGDTVESPLLRGMTENDASPLAAENVYEIPPLTRDECQRLLDCWCQRLEIQLRAEVANDLLNRSGGSPFLLQELLRSYVNYIVRHRLPDETWLSGAQKGSGVLHNRFSMLPPTTEKVLQFLAVSPQPLGIHQLQTASRILPGPLLAELNHLSGQGWIRWNGTTLDSELEISHERFREVVLRSMMEERLHRRHYRLARMLTSEVPPPWRRIAHHYSEARQYRESAACYMEGARTAARRLAFAEALWMLERAFHPMAQRTEAENRAADRLRADCLAGHGNAVAAATAYESLAEATTDDAIVVRCLAGEQWIRAGRLESGLKNLRSVFTQMEVVALENTPWQRARQAIGKFQLARIAPSISPFREAETSFSDVEQCLNRISGPLAFLDGNLGGRLIGRMFRLSMQRGTDFDRAIAIMRWALVLSYFRPRKRNQAIRWMRVGRNLARRSGSQNARAKSHVCMFLWHSLQGRFNISLRYAQRAETLYQAQYASDTWETGFVCWICLGHLWYLGKLKELCARTHSYRQDATQRADAMWIYWMHVNAAHLADLIRDNVAEGRRSLASAHAVLADNVFETPQILLWISRIRQMLYEGDARAARSELLEHWDKTAVSSFMNVSYYEWLIRYLRVLCNLAVMSVDPQQSSLYLQDARSELKRIWKLDQPTFLVYANALKLVTDAAAGLIPPPEQWQSVLQAARRHRLGLLVIAIEWHTAHWHSPEDIHLARQQLLDEGCVAPERLMNVILPLPHA